MGNENSSRKNDVVLPENLDKIDDNVYILQSGFNFMNIAEVGLNGLVICTGAGDARKLVYINPPKFTGKNRATLRTIEQEMGAKIEVILQPGDWHHMQLPDAQEMFPDARLYVASTRNVRKQPKIKAKAVVVDRENPVIAELGEDFELIPWLGFTQDSMPWLMTGEKKGANRIEFVVFHKPSSTLFLTDHFFPPKSGKDPFAEPNTGGFKCVDAAHCKQSIDRILGLNATRVVFSHGPRDASVVSVNAETLNAAYDGLLKAHKIEP